MALKFTVKTRFSNMSRLCVITQNHSLIFCILTWEAKILKIFIHWQIKSWEWCIERNLWVSAGQIPGCNNVETDLYSRELEDAIEWQLNPSVFKNITKTFGTTDLNLFSNGINKKLVIFISWHPEPATQVIDVFSLVWKQMYFYKFPPFSLVGKVLSKAFRESQNYHTKLFISTLIPSNITPQRYYRSSHRN